MNIESLTFSQESFQIIKNELLALRKQNALLKENIVKMETKCKNLETNFCLNKDVVINSNNINETQGLKELLTKSEKEILKAGNDNFLKDNLIDEQQQQIQLLKAEVQRLKQELEKLKPSGKKQNKQQISSKSKIEEFFMSKQIMSLPHEHLQTSDQEQTKQQQKGKKKGKLMRKNRIEVDLDEFNSTETSDQFINS